MKQSVVARRGSYAAMYALSAVAFIGVGAIAVDLSMLRLADAEIQAVADAAAQAGVLELRRTDDRAVAETITRKVIDLNRVAGLAPFDHAITFGLFDGGTFLQSSGQANAVNVQVDVDLQLPFASFWGDPTRTLRGRATAAARPLHTIVVVDITNSWSLSNFLNARDGVVAVFDQVTAAASTADRIGCVVFHGKFGTEYTPLMLVSDAVTSGVRANWVDLRPASRWLDCPSGEKCAPWMPIEYPDETGTDHAIGIQMATKMFAENPDPSVYRAMIVVTDGQPANVGDHEDRWDWGADESRWRYEYTGATARTIPEIKVDTVAYATDAWTNAEVHTWFVSYAQDGQFMEDSAQGDGYFIKTDSSGDLLAIFSDIAESLPITLVE